MLKLLLLTQFLGPLGGVDNMPANACRALGQSIDAQTVALFRADEPGGTDGLLNAVLGDRLTARGTLASVPGQVATARQNLGSGDFSGNPAVPGTAQNIVAAYNASYTLEFILDFYSSQSTTYRVIWVTNRLSYVGEMPLQVFSTAGRLHINIRTAGLVDQDWDAAAMPTDVATHWAIRSTIVGTAQQVDLFKNGLLINSESVTKGGVGTNHAFCIMSDEDCYSGNDTHGWIDEAKFEARAMSDAEIAADACSVGLLAPPLGASLNAAFATPGAYDSPVTIAVGGPVTDTRASTATYLAGSALATANANQLRVQSTGALLEPAATNYVLQSVDLSNAAWATTGTLTVTPNTCPGPTGATDMALLDGTASGTLFNLQNQMLTGLPSSAVVTGSVWLAPQSGSHIGSLDVSNGNPVTSCTCSVQCLDDTVGTCVVAPFPGDCVAQTTVTTLCRLSVTGVFNAATTTANIFAGPGLEGTSNDLLCMGYAQVEQTPFSTSTVVTAGTATARATETATVNAVGIVGASTGSGVLTYTPEWSSSTAGADRIILSTTGVVLKWLNASTAISITAGGATATSAALTWATGSSHALRYRYGGGASSGACVQVDGATEVCSGTFSAFTPTNPLYLNGDVSDGSGGSIAGLKICPANSACN